MVLVIQQHRPLQTAKSARKEQTVTLRRDSPKLPLVRVFKECCAYISSSSSVVSLLLTAAVSFLVLQSRPLPNVV